MTPTSASSPPCGTTRKCSGICRTSGWRYSTWIPQDPSAQPDGWYGLRGRGGIDSPSWPGGAPHTRGAPPATEQCLLKTAQFGRFLCSWANLFCFGRCFCGCFFLLGSFRKSVYTLAVKTLRRKTCAFTTSEAKK